MHVALEVGPVEPADDFGRGCLGGLMGASRAFVKEADNSFDK